MQQDSAERTLKGLGRLAWYSMAPTLARFADSPEADRRVATVHASHSLIDYLQALALDEDDYDGPYDETGLYYALDHLARDPDGMVRSTFDALIGPVLKSAEYRYVNEYDLYYEDEDLQDLQRHGEYGENDSVRRESERTQDLLWASGHTDDADADGSSEWATAADEDCWWRHDRSTSSRRDAEAADGDEADEADEAEDKSEDE